MSMTVTSAPKPTPTTQAFSPTTPAPRIVTRPPPHAGHAGQENALAARDPLERRGPGLHREPPRDLGHRHEQGQRAVGELHRLVGDAHDPAVEEALGQRLRRRKMQIGEEDLARPHQRELGIQGLLDLEHELGPIPDLRRVLDDGRSGPGIGRVGDGAALPRPGLHEHLVVVPSERGHTGRRDRDATLVGLDLGGYADAHERGSGPRRAARNPLQPPKRSRGNGAVRRLPYPIMTPWLAAGAYGALTRHTAPPTARGRRTIAPTSPAAPATERSGALRHRAGTARPRRATCGVRYNGAPVRRAIRARRPALLKLKGEPRWAR